MSLLDRFKGNPKAIIQELMKQKLVRSNPAIAQRIADKGELAIFNAGETIITQGNYDQDVYFILAGEANIIINGKKLPYTRKAGLTIGEMSALNPTNPRAATLIASNETVTIKVDQHIFDDLTNEFPEIIKIIAVDLSERLEERNALINAGNSKPKLFIISTVESVEIARQVKLSLHYDDIEVTIWNEGGVFAAGSYTLESLEKAIKESDFGLAIMQGDDLTNSRGVEYSAPRDNVIFELGLFMGFLTRQRTLLALPHGEKVKVASDLQGLTPLEYKISPTKVADVTNLTTVLRQHIKSLGPKLDV